MRKMAIAICDEQEAYRERLAEYFIRRKSDEAQVYTFSSRRLFLERRKDSHFDLVLRGKGFEEIKGKEDKDGLYISLCETPDLAAYEAPAVFKYQPAEAIWRKMFCHYTELGRENAYVSDKPKEVIGIYSPTQCRFRMPFTLTMAQLLSAEKRVLYVNLAEWAGFDGWLQENCERDLADLMYLISCHGVNLQGILESVVHTANRMDYIPPMRDAQLLCQTAEEDYRKLLDLLVEKTDYEVLLLDFGIMVPGFFSLLERCTSVYAIVDQGTVGKRQCAQFEEGMVKAGASDLAERMRTVTFGASDERIFEQEPVIQQWLYGGLGDRVRAARYGTDGTDSE